MPPAARLCNAGELQYLVDERDQRKSVVPDLYILEGEPQTGPKLPSWKPWEHGGKVPSLVVEVVSDAYEKDYSPEEGLQRYEQLGVPEVVGYDLDAPAASTAMHLMGAVCISALAIFAAVFPDDSMSCSGSVESAQCRHGGRHPY